MDLSFIKCTIEDINRLRDISIETFSDAFEADNDPVDFKTHLDYAFSKQKMRFELLNPNSKFYFVYQDKELVGYLKMNYNDAQTEHFYPNAVELERLYVVKEKQNQGLGRTMLEFAIKKAKNRNPSFMWLGVWEKNEGAQRFYERHGFENFGTHPYFIGTDKQNDYLFRLNLT